MTELAKYEAAERALAAAEAVDEVLEIRSQAEAWRSYARQAKNRDLEIKAARIRFRAERRLGEMLVEQKETIGLNRGRAGAGRPALGDSDAEQPKTDDRPTLAEAGIDRKLSSKAQKLAAMDLAAFEQALERHAEEMRGGTGRVAMDLHRVVSEETGREHRRDLAQTLSEASAALPGGRRYPVIYADPAWRRHQGVTDRSYENHYPTMTWAEICALPIADMVLPDAWLFLWIPRAHAFALHQVETEVEIVGTGEIVQAKVDMPLGWAVAKAWGFDNYSTMSVWTKTDNEHPNAAGTGKIFRDQDELLLLFKRGRGLPMPEQKFGSNHRERPREHSRKPDFYRDMIASMVGGLPVLELFARVDAEHPLPQGWGAWGNQSGSELPATATGSVDDLGSVQDALKMSTDGHTEAAAADATSDRASAAAAVTDGAPYDAGDVVTIDQLAGSEWLAAAELDALELSELEQLKILSDFCHPKRAAMQAVLGPLFRARELAYLSGDQWSLREAGRARLRSLQDAATAPAPAALTEPYRSPQPSLFDLARQLDDAPPAEIVDGVLQTRLPVDADELAEQIALLAIAAGDTVESQTLRHLIGKGLAHCGTKTISITDDGRAFLAQLVSPASVQQQGAAL